MGNRGRLGKTDMKSQVYFRYTDNKVVFNKIIRNISRNNIIIYSTIQYMAKTENYAFFQNVCEEGPKFHGKEELNIFWTL